MHTEWCTPPHSSNNRRLAIFLCSCITNVFSDGVENPALSGRNTQQNCGEGGREMVGSQGKLEKKRQSHPAVCFSVFHCTASCWHNKHLGGVPTEASTVLVGGLNHFGCSKAQEGTARGEWQGSPECWLFGSFWNWNMLLLSLSLPGKRSAPFGVGEKCWKVVKPDEAATLKQSNVLFVNWSITGLCDGLSNSLFTWTWCAFVSIWHSALTPGYCRESLPCGSIANID